MQTVTLPKRKKKSASVIPAELITNVRESLAKVKKGQAVAFEPEKWYDTEGKARGKARVMALAIAELGDPQPRTHVIPSQDGEQFTPAVSPGK